MPVFLVTSPDGQKFRVTGPEGSTQEQAIEYIQSQMASMPVEQKAAPQEGITAALTGGFKRFLSTGETAAESLINPELAAQRGVERSRQIGEQYAPGASLEKVKQAYESEGLFPAIKEGISQIPAALAEQAPQIAATLGSARLGAMAGSPLGPVGAVVGGVAGAVAPSLVQLYGSNLERQAEEKAPISRAGAFGAAVPGAALEVASQFIPLRRSLVGKLLGPKADEFLRKGSEEAIETAARESLTTSLTKGAGVGALAEIPTEVAQQMLERYQAGLSLTDEQAIKEYVEAAYGAGLVGGPFGAGARALGRPGARAKYQRQQQEEEARLAVTDEELAQRFPDILPGGLRIEEQELSREMAPAGYSILAEGREEPLSVVDTAEEAQAKLESLTQIREQERAKLLEEDQKIDTDVQKAQARLEQLEATEQAGTEEYQTLKADLPRMMDEAAQKKAELFDRVEKLGAPLSVTPFGEVERVNKQFNVVTPSGSVMQSFATRGEAEADVRKMFGEEAFDLKKKNIETARQLYKTFVPQMRKFGLGDVGLQIVDRIENGAGGAYLNKLIKVSLEDTKPIQTMRHESLHAMKDLGFFTPQQWKALEERASKEWIKKYLEGQQTEIDGKKMTRLEGYRKLKYSEQDIIEEAIADAFGDYDKGAKPPPGLIAALFRKIKNFFSSLGQALRGAGFQSAEDIFQGIEQGKLKPAKEAKPAAEEKLSLAPKGIPQKIWDLHEKAQQADEEAAGRVASGKAPGALKRNQTMSFRRLNEAVMDFVGGDEKKAEDLMVQMNQESSRREEKLSLKRAAVEGEVEISTQNPTGPKRAYDPIAQMLSIDEKAVMEAMKSNPDYRKATIKALKSYGFIPEGVKDKDVIELFKNNIVDNLLYLYNLVPEKIRKRSKLWYDGANKISEQMAEKYGLSLRQVSAIMAAMSPQKDWFQNVSMGERAIDILTKHGDRSWTPEMLQYAESYVKETKDRAEREKRQEAFEKIKQVAARGTTLNNMDIKSAAAFIRAYDEAFHSRQYRIVTPEGGFGNNVVNDDGTPSTLMWSTYSPIEKAVSIYRDGSRENVSEQLGFEHKIRSFYNNIAAPNSDLEHVTIDTHAVAAALFEALAGTDPEVVQNFGGTGKTSITGVGGTYGLIADAYREAARKVGVLPREMQSITWEAVRGLFSQEIKNAIKNPVKAEWAKYKSGDQSFEQTRQNIIEISRNKRTNDKGVDIPPPDWVDSGKGEFVEDGGESYDKSYVPTGGVRLREEQEIREKLTFNLSAVTGSIPGLRELYDRALKRDEKAGTVLQEVADASLTHLLSGTNAKVVVTRAKGVYLSDREPSLMVAASFNESEGKDVLAALARFAKNFNQEQIHVRMPTKKKVGFEYGDGSYTTNVFTIPLKKELNDKAISDIIDKSGLKGFTVTNDSLITYFVRPNKDQGESNEQYAKRIDQEFKVFEEQVASAHVLAGRPGTKVGRKIERLFVYGTGYGAAIDYESILGDVRPKQGADTVTPRLIAEYLTGKPVQVFKQKDLTKAQIAQQEKLARTFDSLPVNDLKNPMVKKAYKALTKALKEQFAVLPIKVELQTEKDSDGNIVPPYNNNSSAMRKDILERNHMLVYPTTPETFGPEGYDFSGHPLLEDSGFKDINGEPMLFNDVLRAVHDYFAHGMSEAQFGPKGEFTAWRNHMASTPDPMARWALTAETRMQNAWQNFSEGAQNVPLKDRPFALQKAALPPTEFLYTGDNSVDLPVYQMEQELSDKQKRGSEPTAKFSLKNVRFPTVKEAKEAVKAAGTPNTEAFKLFNAGNQWVDADGKPKVFYHATARDFFEFTPAGQSQAIFLAETPEEAETFGSIAEDKLRREVYSALGLKEDKLKFLQGVVDRAVEKGTITKKEGDDFMKQANRKTPAYGDFGDIEQDVYDALIELSPTRMSIMPLYARAMAPFDFENKEHVDQVMNWVANNTQYPQDFPEKWLNGMKGRISQGLWQAIEDKRVQQAIRALGFDAFTVRENRASAKNYAVYKPNQVKSVTGNDGQFSLESKDIRYSLSRAAYTPERVDQLLGRYAYTQNDAENDTKAYVARVSPKDFLNATTTRDGMERIREESTPLDTDRLMKESQPIMLLVQQGKVGNTDVWEITGHEGRHRMMALADAGYDSVPVVFDFGRRVSKAKPVDMKYVVRQNFGGEIGKAISDFTVSDAIPVSYGQEKALRGFEETKGIKFSLPNLSADTMKRINEVTPGRYEPAFKDRVIGLFKQDFTGLRQKFLNRYEALAALDRRLRELMRRLGGPELLADQSAEFAALQSDLAAGVTASAMGIGDRQGGVPVYRNGFTTIDTSVKGLTEALAPLAKYGDPEVYRAYQFWAGWKRGRRLLREGREQVYTPADAKYAQEIEAKYPEFEQVQKDLVAFNNGIVNFAVQTGVLSRERAQVYTKYADYIPFYRQLDLDKTIGPNPFSGISGLRGPKELKGGEAPLGDFMENLVRNTQSMINAGMKNAAAQKATKVALQLKEVERLPGPAKGVGYDVYTQLENGELVYYRSADPLFIDALKSLNMPDLPFMGLLSAPANVLRNLVTKDPGFMMANLLRDSLSSYVTSGQNVTPIVGTMVNFGKALSGKDKNLQSLFNAGVIGGYEFSQNVEQSGKSLSADLNKKAGKDAILLRPFKSLWEGLEKGTTASDAATRMAVYERVMKETGNEAEAISRALEVMNFNRKGNSILIRIATAALPFFNARLQGLDLFYRASTGRMDTQDAKEIKRKFWVRGMTMAALSAMYYMSVAGDDDYEEQEKETKENNWIIPSLGIRIPIPFEVGTLFKTMPETITAYWMGKATGEDLMGTTKRALMNTFAFNPFPQTFRPLYEVITNYNFFTGREIVGQDLKDVEPRYQIGPRTSKFAEILGDQLNVSPLKLDQLIKGYTGTIGGYVTFAVDSIISEFSDVPKASRRFEQMPIVSRFALDPEARGKVTQFYELGQSVDTVVRTMSLLEKTARPEEYAKFLQDNIGVLAVKDNVRSIEKAMKELRDTKRMINNLDMPPDEKRDLLTDLGRAEKNLVVNIGELRRVVSELK